MHGPAVWELWNVNSNRQIEIKHRKSKCLQTGDDFTMCVAFSVSWPEFYSVGNLKPMLWGNNSNQKQTKQFRKSCSILAWGARELYKEQGERRKHIFFALSLFCSYHRLWIALPRAGSSHSISCSAGSLQGPKSKQGKLFSHFREWDQSPAVYSLYFYILSPFAPEWLNSKSNCFLPLITQWERGAQRNRQMLGRFWKGRL